MRGLRYYLRRNSLADLSSGEPMFNLGKRIRIRLTADSELGQLYAGRQGQIVEFAKDPETLILKRYTVRLDDGTFLELKPDEVEILE